MNAHQKYVAALVAGLQPVDVATMIAIPPSPKATKAHRIEDVQQHVLDYATPETRMAWADLLAAAAAQPRQADWPPDWAIGIGELIFAIDLPDEGEVHELGQRAA